jgi:hypothetical protein
LLDGLRVWGWDNVVIFLNGRNLRDFDWLGEREYNFISLGGGEEWYPLITNATILSIANIIF